jgi:hypothetical protein
MKTLVVTMIRVFDFITVQYRYKIKSIGIVTGYGLDGRDSIPGNSNSFSLLHSIQAISGTHTASYQMGTVGAFPGGKAVIA